MSSKRKNEIKTRYLSGAQKRQKRILKNKMTEKLRGSMDQFILLPSNAILPPADTSVSSTNEYPSYSSEVNPQIFNVAESTHTANDTSSHSSPTIVEDTCEVNPHISNTCKSTHTANDSSDSSPSIVEDTSIQATGDCEPACIPPADPAFWQNEMTSVLQEYFCKVKPQQNIELIKCSNKVIGDKERKLTQYNFFRKKKNNELVPRDWLIFSPSTNAVFCYVCKLFGTSEQSLCKSGFSDWRNINQRLTEHENSYVHRESVGSYSKRCNASERIDKQMLTELENECKYWKNVLRRVIAVIKHLCQRGLPLFGSDETLNSQHNGNFMGTLQLVSVFDPFLADHLTKYANIGSGHTNYLSSTIVDEIIELMADKVLSIIQKEIKVAKYYGVIVDSTPDISHIDQLSIIVRYVDEKGEPLERFIHFVPIHSHGSSNLCDSIVNLFQNLEIEIENCRGQSYDNASNMAGRYTGLQARIKELSPLAEYVPCAAHSLNLVGSVAVESCNQTITFFGFIQSLYNFFSASTHRWNILNTKLQEFSEVNKRMFTLKSLSQTKWSAHAEATKALRKGHAAVKAALEFIVVNEEEKKVTRHEAKCLASKLEELETAILIIVWDTILQRINKVSQTLQKESCVFSAIVPLYESLIKHVQNVRDNFADYETEAYQLVGESAVYTVKRQKKAAKSKMLDESSGKETCLTAREAFIYNCHYVLCDSLLAELNKRIWSWRKGSDSFIKSTMMNPKLKFTTLLNISKISIQLILRMSFRMNFLSLNLFQQRLIQDYS